MKPGYWILDPDHRPVPADLLTWGRMFGRADRHVAHTELPNGYTVSTVFLGIDHGWDDEGPPILFETMTFPSDERQLQARYATWDEAVIGHNLMVEQVRGWTSRHITHFFSALRWRMRHWPLVGVFWRMSRFVKKQRSRA